MLVWVLGAGLADDGGAPLRPKERVLLAALAVRAPSAVSTASLIDALWPCDPPVSARKTLQNHVLRVRQRLGTEVIATVGDGYRLCGPEVLDTDLARFERGVREAGAGVTVEWWDRIVALCPENPLDDLRHWTPADGRRVQLEEMRLAAMEARWEAAMRDGSPPDAVAALEAMVAEAPLRENGWRLLLAAYQQAGRRAEALRTFERARRTLAVELGVPPGSELVEAYESVLLDVPVSLGARQGEQRAVEACRPGASAPLTAELAAGVGSFAQEARQARDRGDLRGFAEAALAASGDGWRTGFDATADAAALLSAALAAVPPAPTPLRARLLARSAVVRSHHASVSDCETLALKALAIADALDDANARAGALHALAVVVWDPARRAEQRAWLDALVGLATVHAGAPWRLWAAPVLARALVRDGDIEGAQVQLARLAAEGAASADAIAAHGASFGPVLASSVTGDWAAVRVAVKDACAAADAAGFDPAGTMMQRRGMLGIVALLEGPKNPPPLAPVEWPLSSMALAVEAWHVDCLARAGRVGAAADALRHLDPDTVLDVERDGYWLATLSMLADAAYVTGDAAMSEVVTASLVPFAELTIADPGLLYRGAAAHFAGLAALACGRRAAGRELVSLGLATHERHGSTWMAARSREMLARA